jgi:hypothetical protein
MISIRKAGSPTSSPASPAIQLTDSTNCSRGTGDLLATPPPSPRENRRT